MTLASCDSVEQACRHYLVYKNLRPHRRKLAH